MPLKVVAEGYAVVLLRATPDHPSAG